MSKSQIRDILAWVQVTSLKFFVECAFAAVPLIVIILASFGTADVLRMCGLVKRQPDNTPVGSLLFAGIVISLLLCIGTRIGAFDGLFQNKRE